jgi:4'-phosphopantetheinyl transferase
MLPLWCDDLPPMGPLPAGAVHVWRIDLDAAADPSVLSADEHDRAARYRAVSHRERFMAARVASRRILARYLAANPRDVRFTVGRFGKPALLGSSVVRFNLSHSGGLALLAVSGWQDVGIDLEQIRSRENAAMLVERYFAPAERAEFAALPPEQQPLAFLLGWTRKEAFVKALGDGLQCPLDSFAVSLTPSRPAQLTLPPGGHTAHEWVIHDLNPGHGYVAALVVCGSCESPVGFTYRP